MQAVGRPVAWLAPLFFTLTLVGGLTSDRSLDPPFEGVRPWGLLSDSLTGALGIVGLLGMVGTLLVAAATLVVRYRHADLTVRRQLEEIALAGLLLPLAMIGGTLDPTGRPVGSPDLRALHPAAGRRARQHRRRGAAVTRLDNIDRVVATTVVLRDPDHAASGRRSSRPSSWPAAC